MGLTEEGIKACEQEVLGLLEQGASLRLSLSENEGDYHSQYVSKKITECAVMMEKLSDIQMRLTKISLDVTLITTTQRYQLKLETDSVTATQEYQQVPMAGRNQFLTTKLGKRNRTVENLNYLTRLVSEVRQAISERLQTMKRLDSDVRLHQKILEGRLGSDATSDHSYKGAKETNLDL